jgi:hypothetical protein
MKGPKEYKRYVSKYKDRLKAIHWDDLYLLLVVPNCKKWRKTKRRPRDGYGIRPNDFD